MGIWAEIKHALNSTLGTSSFKPLNTLITDFVTTKASELTTHITTQATGVKTAVSTTETNIKTHTTSEATTIKNLVTTETTGVETHVTTKTNETKTHVTTQVENSKQAILNQLYNSKTLLASDEVFYTFPDTFAKYYYGTPSYSTYTSDFLQFTMPLSGSVNFLYKVGLDASGKSGQDYVVFSVLKNNEVCHTFDTSYAWSSSSLSSQTVRLDGVRGDVFKISIKLVNTRSDYEYRPIIGLYSLNATIKDSETINLQMLV